MLIMDLHISYYIKMHEGVGNVPLIISKIHLQEYNQIIVPFIMVLFIITVTATA